MKYIKQVKRRPKYRPKPLLRSLRPQNFGVLKVTNNRWPVKCIFLNIEGVLSPYSEWIEEYKPDVDKLPRLWRPQMRLLEDILWNTGAYIVITSEARREDIEWLQAEFTEQGFKFPERIIAEVLHTRFYQATDAIINVPTGSEIDTWLQSYISFKHPGRKYGEFLFNYCIIDWRLDMLLTQRHYFLLTQEEVGLTETIANKAIKILNHEE